MWYHITGPTGLSKYENLLTIAATLKLSLSFDTTYVEILCTSPYVCDPL